MRIISPEQISKDQRKPHLHNHQGLACAVPLAALAQSAASFAKSAGRPCAGKLDNWDGSDEQARKQREPRGEKKNGNIDADLVDARQAGRRHRHQHAQSAKGQAQSNARACNAENDTLEQQIGRGSSPRRAECGANREFLTAAFYTHQQKVSNVGACNQQNHGDGAHQYPQHFAHVADHVQL